MTIMHYIFFYIRRLNHLSYLFIKICLTIAVIVISLSREKNFTEHDVLES